MEGNYCEVSVVKAKEAKDTMIKVLLILGMILSLFLMVFVTGWFFVLLVGVGILAYYIFPSLNVVYEYVFCDGQIDFDKIMSGERRKHVARVDMDEIVVCAPIASSALDGYRREGVKKEDFSSRTENGKVYGIVTGANNRITLYLFEPSEEMLYKMKQKAPRKVASF